MSHPEATHSHEQPKSPTDTNPPTNTAQISPQSAGIAIPERSQPMTQPHEWATCLLATIPQGRSDHLGVDVENVRNEVGDPLTGTVVLRPQLKILDPVIGLVSIDVVNRFIRKQWTPQVLRHREPMAVGVPLSVGVRAIPAHPDSRVSVRGYNGSHFAPRLVGRAPAVDARRTARAVLATRPTQSVAVGVHALRKRHSSIFSRTRRRTPFLPIGSRPEDCPTLATSPFVGHPRAGGMAIVRAVFLPVIRWNVARAAGSTRSRPVGMTHNSDVSTFTGLSAFDKHRDGDHANSTRRCLPPDLVGLVDAGRDYPCWGFPGDPDRWADSSAETDYLENQ